MYIVYLKQYLHTYGNFKMLFTFEILLEDYLSSTENKGKLLSVYRIDFVTTNTELAKFVS
jgi:hypothetical protein